MIEFLIVRHGHSVANEKGIFAGATDVPLSKIGKKQAELVSDYIIENYSVNAIYSSELTRAKDTVKKVSERLNVPIITNPAFNEIYGGKWENVTFEEIYKKYPEDLLRWRNDIANSKCTDGESFSNLRERTINGLKSLTVNHDGERIIIATHAGATKAMLCSIMNLSAEECAKLDWVSNASITTVIFNEGKFSLKQFSFDAYLSSLKTTLPNNI